MALPVPNPRTYAVGEVEDAAYLNSLRDALNFLLNPPQGQFYQTAAQSIPNNAFTPLAFDTTAVDSYGGHSNSTNNSRYTAIVAGWYEFTGAIAFPANGTGTRDGSWAKNGSLLTAPGGSAIVGGSAAMSAVFAIPSMQIFMNAGDYVELQAFQSSGGALNTSTGQFGCLMSVKWTHV